MNGKNKISIIGAGNVGSLLALRILEHDMADVILLDIDENISKGKACDLRDASPIMGYEKSVEGTSDYSKIRDSHIVVVTAGFPRKSGMVREELIRKNGFIVKQIAAKIKEFAPESIIIVVTNPLDVMSYLAYRVSGFDRRKVLGMAGALDSSRCSNIAAEELGVMKSEVDCIVIGSHDKNMLPLFYHSKAQGRPLKKILSETGQNRVLEKTKGRGAEIVAKSG
ncbi:MAG: malate dehydrogenase, partial [Candidatus Omnitrophota bacterium]|nr:malate dehydrogenase [Candidatus Omnitrophota bacterium]